MKWTSNTWGWQGTFVLWEHSGGRFWEWLKVHVFEFHLPLLCSTGSLLCEIYTWDPKEKAGLLFFGLGQRSAVMLVPFPHLSIPSYSQPHVEGPSLFPSYLCTKDNVWLSYRLYNIRLIDVEQVLITIKTISKARFYHSLTRSKNICLEIKVYVSQRVRPP